jgi:hypothetical protein
LQSEQRGNEQVKDFLTENSDSNNMYLDYSRDAIPKKSILGSRLVISHQDSDEHSQIEEEMLDKPETPQDDEPQSHHVSDQDIASAEEVKPKESMLIISSDGESSRAASLVVREQTNDEVVIEQKHDKKPPLQKQKFVESFEIQREKMMESVQRHGSIYETTAVINLSRSNTSITPSAVIILSPNDSIVPYNRRLSRPFCSTFNENLLRTSNDSYMNEDNRSENTVFERASDGSIEVSIVQDLNSALEQQSTPDKEMQQKSTKRSE